MVVGKVKIVANLRATAAARMIAVAAVDASCSVDTTAGAEKGAIVANCFIKAEISAVARGPILASRSAISTEIPGFRAMLAGAGRSMMGQNPLRLPFRASMPNRR